MDSGHRSSTGDGHLDANRSVGGWLLGRGPARPARLELWRRQSNHVGRLDSGTENRSMK